MEKYFEDIGHNKMYLKHQIHFLADNTLLFALDHDL